ncbi:MAG: hypothetical protein EXS37_17165 [Opitutus sp.]|nr:hypothetical protein [Opitutus sp.]
MRELFSAARDLQAFCRAGGWSFCFIGGLAVWRWGKPRFTQDLVVMKAFAGRPHDWGDVDAILARQGSSLDWNYIYSHLSPLAELKEAPELVTQLRSLERKWKQKEPRLDR